MPGARVASARQPSCPARQYVVIDNNLRQAGFWPAARPAGWQSSGRILLEKPSLLEKLLGALETWPSPSEQITAKAAADLSRRGGGDRDAAPRLDFAELDGHIGYFLRRLQVAVFTNFISTLAPLDVRPAQYSVLVLIAANPGRSQSAIGQALNIERARLARMLHELERRKWIERRAAPDDRRSHSLYLTDGGVKALVRIRSLAARHEARMVEVIGRERRLQLLELLREFG